MMKSCFGNALNSKMSENKLLLKPTYLSENSFSLIVFLVLSRQRVDTLYFLAPVLGVTAHARQSSAKMFTHAPSSPSSLIFYIFTIFYGLEFPKTRYISCQNC